MQRWGLTVPFTGGASDLQAAMIDQVQRAHSLYAPEGVFRGAQLEVKLTIERGEGGVDAVCGCEAVAACLAGATPSATVRFIPREQGNSKATQSAGRGSGRWT